MKHYGSLAMCYDDMTSDVDYAKWADYIEMHIAKTGKKAHTILDLACGTGTLSWILAERQYEMIGVDFSPDMLSQAMAKTSSAAKVAPMFLCQSMEDLDLYGTVDACVCMLDSVNHVVEVDTLKKAFSRVHLFLEPDGLFMFDILTKEHLERLDGGMFLDETEEAYCVWRTEYDKNHRICTYIMDVFLQEGDHWEREQEVHEEYAYTIEELTQYLKEAGFCDIEQHGNLEMRPPQEGEERIFFTARKKGD